MSNEKFNKPEDDLIKKMREARSQEELLRSIPEDMRKRLDSVMNNEEELKKILNSERAKALYDKIKEIEKG